MIKEHDRIVLLKDLPEYGLKKDDVGTVIHVHGESEAFEIEFMTLSGETIAIATKTHKIKPSLTTEDPEHTESKNYFFPSPLIYANLH